MTTKSRFDLASRGIPSVVVAAAFRGPVIAPWHPVNPVASFSSGVMLLFPASKGNRIWWWRATPPRGHRRPGNNTGVAMVSRDPTRYVRQPRPKACRDVPRSSERPSGRPRSGNPCRCRCGAPDKNDGRKKRDANIHPEAGRDFPDCVTARFPEASKANCDGSRMTGNAMPPAISDGSRYNQVKTNHRFHVRRRRHPWQTWRSC